MDLWDSRSCAKSVIDYSILVSIKQVFIEV